MKLRRLDSAAPDFQRRLRELRPTAAQDADVQRAAAEIVEQVRDGGDAALLALCNRLDDARCASPADLALQPDEFRRAFAELPARQRDALQLAAQRIERYHREQLAQSWSYADQWGNRLGQRVRPLDRAGVYVPGGQAAYPSTVLMCILPARVAGVEEIAVAMPAPGGVRNPLALAALHLAGVEEAYAIGGAQAVAALAYGTESIAPVDKIVGPGGAFVAAAKRQVFGKVGIDLIAGPSEILILTDGSPPLDWVAWDLLAQAEHDALAQSLLLCPEPDYLDALAARIEALLPARPRRAIIAESLQGRGALIRTRSLEEALEIANDIAPEHLHLAVRAPADLLDGVRHAGAIFLGAQSPEVMGDYVAGPSHVLPTYGTARFSSPLGVYDFQKRSSVIELTGKGARALAPAAAALALGEGLEAHARSAQLRGEG